MGSVIGLVDPAGTQRAAYSYDPYGSNATATGVNGALPANPWRWAGGYLDAVTGLYHFGARYYDPTMGRFTQVDPVEGGSCNDYDYACADPVNLRDLTGTMVYGACGAGSFGWGLTLTGTVCVLRDDSGGSIVTYSGGFGGGLEAGGGVVGYYSNAPTVNDVLGWSACVSGGAQAGGSFCVFEGRDGESYFSVSGGAFRGQAGGSITAVYTKKAPRWATGPIRSFIRG